MAFKRHLHSAAQLLLGSNESFHRHRRFAAEGSRRQPPKHSLHKVSSATISGFYFTFELRYLL